jgi:hypothetical protein
MVPESEWSTPTLIVSCAVAAGIPAASVAIKAAPVSTPRLVITIKSSNRAVRTCLNQQHPCQIETRPALPVDLIETSTNSTVAVLAERRRRARPQRSAAVVRAIARKSCTKIRR